MHETTNETILAIAENPADTMRHACMGPRWGQEYTAAESAYQVASAGSAAEREARETMQRLEAAQEAGETVYGRQWAENAARIAEERGLEAQVVVTGDLRTTCTPYPSDPDDLGRTVEMDVWQAAHDATPEPSWSCLEARLIHDGTDDQIVVVETHADGSEWELWSTRIESVEDAGPYDAALASHGFSGVAWAEQSL